MTSRKRLGRFAFLPLLLLLGLSAMANAPLTWDAAKFADDADARHLKALLKAVPARTSGWQHLPLRTGGNFLTEQWMKGQGDVLNESYMTGPGNAWYKVEALLYDLPNAFGCLFSAGRNPAKDGIGVRFWYSSGGKTIVGEGADLDFTVWEGGKAVANLPVIRVPVVLPEPYELEGVAVKDDWRASLSKLADLKSFQASANDRYQRTLTGFQKALKEGRVKKRVYGEYQGGGIPPESHLVAITPAEADDLKRHVEAEVAGWKRTLTERAPEMHKTMLEVVPLSALLK